LDYYPGLITISGLFCTSSCWSTSVDDILIYSETPEEHASHLRQVLEVLRNHKLFANARKYSFAQPELSYLGHVNSADGIKADCRKAAAVTNWPTPTSLGDLRSFLGLASYFRKFVRDFAKMGMPLYRLMRKGVAFSWIPDCQQAFYLIKRALIEAPCLAFPDFTQPL
jgi:Reverse transcriptase (RNA-dependent DNA polymerase)